MSNIMQNVKNWLCQVCEYQFQAPEAFRSSTGQEVCLACCSESYESAE